MTTPNDRGTNLPNHPRMLEIGSSKAWNIASDDQEVGTTTVATPYFVVEITAKPDGGSLLGLWSRPAFEVVMLHHSGDQIWVTLIRKQIESGRVITKLPGGYDQTGGRVSVDGIIERILQDTGRQLNPEYLHCIGQVPGHGEIHLPISLWVATGYELIEKPRDGIEVITVTLDEAMEMAMRAMRPWEWQAGESISNDTGVEALFLIERIIRCHPEAITMAP